jgi:hypothetical protein
MLKNTSPLFDEDSFYSQFLDDLIRAKSEVIIESPFITTARTSQFLPIFKRLLTQDIKIYVFTRDPSDHQGYMALQAEEVINTFESLGIQTFICRGNFHRKLAMIDRSILWEGSLNILSQTNSREIMRRFDDTVSAGDMFAFLHLGKFI